MPHLNTDPLENLLLRLQSSPKYRAIHPGLVRRLAQTELAKGRSLKEAEKALRNKLHQVGGAYFPAAAQYQSWLAALTTAAQTAPGSIEQFPAFRQACLLAMGGHTSTRERLPHLEAFYDAVFSALPPIGSLLDVACGFNPLALPWMLLQPGAQYHAFDIYADMVQFLNAYFALVGVAGQAFQADALEDAPLLLGGQQMPARYDLALVLKTIPCLEQVDKDAGARLLRRLPAHFILVTYPVHSLSGRSKGMPAFYSAAFDKLIERAFPQGVRSVQRLDFATELAFLVETAHRPEIDVE